MTELTNACNRVSLNTINQIVKIPSMRANPEGIPLWTLKEDKTNKVFSISDQSTDTEYPSAKCVYDALQNIPTGQIQSDWDQTDTEAVDYIKHKPSLASVATSGSYTDLSDKPTIPVVPTNVSAFTNDAGYITSSQVPAQVQSDWSQTDTEAVDFIKNKPSLATVATSGSYADLSNKPTIPVVAQSISSGDTGYATGDQVYQVVGDVESLLLALRGNV